MFKLNIIFILILILFILKIIDGLPRDIVSHKDNQITAATTTPKWDVKFEYVQKNAKQDGNKLNTEIVSKINYMDRTADPCNDFYQYACGNWETQHQIPDDLASYDIFAILNEELRISLHQILITKMNEIENNGAATKSKQTKTTNEDGVNENGIPNNIPFDMEQQVNTLFTSCADIETINERGLEPILNLLKKFGGFPLLHDADDDADLWSAANYNLEETLALQSIYQMKSFFYTEIQYDLKDIEKSVIYLQNPELGLRSHADYLESYNKLHLDGYRQFIREILSIFTKAEDKIDQVVGEIIEFECKLANLTDIRKNNYKVEQMYDAHTVGLLKEKYSGFNWTEYLYKIFNKEFNDEHKIVIFGAPKTDDIFDLLMSTDKRILANYISWRTIQQMLDYLDERFQAPKDKFNKILTGSEKTQKSREYICTVEVNSAVGMAVSSLYVKKHFDERFKEDVSKMTKDISNVFRENLFTHDWIDDETKQLAEAKVNKTALAVGYPDFILNKTELNKYYKGIDFKKGKYFENILNLKYYESMKEQEKLNKKIDKFEWPIWPTIVNAFFEQPKNRIIMPAAILQPPVYYGKFPKSLNYGAIGVFIGHELTHGFDSVGRGFDQDGNMFNWWTNKSYTQFKERAQCFVDQYSEFKIYNKTLNGEITKEENIADNGGVRLAYKVFSNWLSKASDEEKSAEIIPDVELSPQQLFFVAFAQSWCEYIRPEAIENRLETDTHPPGKFRIIGTLQNFEEFAKAYQCPIDSVMNPTKKCKLW